MLGTLCRYLRLMGYDTMSANSIAPGNPGEDTLLLGIAFREGRFLLTRDRELAKRGGSQAVYIRPMCVLSQLHGLADLGLVEPRLRLTRCSLCNEKLRPALTREVSGANYAPERRDGIPFYWCVRCRKLYWAGSHTRDLADRLKKEIMNFA